MNTKKILKKLPYYFLLALLTMGAVAIIGFLSFSGMYALWPIISLALSSFILSVAYEGEIYFQNIKGSLNKLFKPNYLKYQLARDYLLEQFTKKIDPIDTSAEDCPQFFKVYEARLRKLHKFSHKRLDAKSQLKKRQLEKNLNDLEKWFSTQLFSSKTKNQQLTDYEISLRNWIKSNQQNESQQLLKERNSTHKAVKFGSGIAGVLMGIGITYLLVEAFAVLPFLAGISAAALPFIIIPLALVAGAAYTLLIYNAATDMIHNKTLNKWYTTLSKDFEKGITVRHVAIAGAAVLLLALNIVLTLCTAGTWWTIVTKGKPLFSWMANTLKYVFAVTISTIIGCAQLIFNLQNTSDSLDLIYDAIMAESSIFTKIAKHFVVTFDHIIATENWLQILNPFRLLLKLTVTPLRLIAFFGHLISIGVTADRVPGLPEIVTAILGIISEGFEDLHYFVGDLFHADHHHHDTKGMLKERLGAGHSHDHSADLPTRLIHLIFSPVYLAATGWDYLATRTGDPLSRLVHFLLSPIYYVAQAFDFTINENKTTNPCGLVKLTNEAKLSFAKLSEKLQGMNAVVMHKDELFYANQRTQEIKKIKVREENIYNYEWLKTKFVEGFKLADDEDLELIVSLTGRHGSVKPISWKDALDKQRGLPSEESVTIKPSADEPSDAGLELSLSLFLIDNFRKKDLQNPYLSKAIAQEKDEGLQNLRTDLSEMQDPTKEAIKQRIIQESANPVHAKHRFFNQTSNTATKDFLANLYSRVDTAAVCA
ncbi:MAG: hypothetical protein H0U73_08575 [Tatlockia sp.]|nr:hypothetical protein [Tatlockia sp.]